MFISPDAFTCLPERQKGLCQSYRHPNSDYSELDEREEDLASMDEVLKTGFGRYELGCGLCNIRCVLYLNMKDSKVLIREDELPLQEAMASSEGPYWKWMVDDDVKSSFMNGPWR